MTQLGGHAIYLDAEKTQVRTVKAKDFMGVILSRYGHGLAIATTSPPTRATRGCARSRAGPTSSHQPPVRRQPPGADARRPDDAPRREHRGENLRGLKVAVSWAYAPSYAKPLSVPQGLATLLPRFGIDVVLAHHPASSWPRARRSASSGCGGRGIDPFTHDMDEAFAGADVVYPKSWGRLDAFSNEKSALAESAEFEDWIYDAMASRWPVPTCCTCCLPADRSTGGHGRGHRRALRSCTTRPRTDAHREGALCVDHGWLCGQPERRREAEERSGLIGGNSLIKDRFHRTVRDQYIAAGETCWHIASMIQDGWDVAIGHGNGPQVGFILQRSELAAGELHEVPLDVCGADSQGAIGYALTQNLENDFRRLGIDRHAVTGVTQVEVARDDPAFASPSKPIGSFMDEATAIETP